MVKSKAWNWNIAFAPWWEEPATEVYSLLKRWQKQSFKKILDLGCGIGRHAVLFSENGFEVNACDLSKEGIEKLNKLIKAHNLSITTEISDMLSLPYNNKSFDGLVAFHTIYHTDDIGIKKTIQFTFDYNILWAGFKHAATKISCMEEQIQKTISTGGVFFG